MAKHEAAGRHVKPPKAPKVPRPKNKKARKVIAIVLICALLLGGAGTGVFMYLRSRGGGVNVYPVDQLTAEPDMYSQNQTDGMVTTDKMQSVYISSTQTVTAVYVTEGQELAVGDRILSFDTTLSEVQLEKARIAVEQTKLDLQDAEDMLKEIATYKVGSPGGGYTPQSTPEPTPLPEDPPGFQFGEGTFAQPYVFLWRDGMILNESTMDALARIAWTANHASDEPSAPPEPTDLPEETGAIAPLGALRPVGLARPAVLRAMARDIGPVEQPLEASPDGTVENDMGDPMSSEQTDQPTETPGETEGPEQSPPAEGTETPAPTEPEETTGPEGTEPPEVTDAPVPEGNQTPEPTDSPDPSPSPSPTPTPTPSPSPTPIPTPEPTPEPDEDPSGEPEPTPKPDCEYFMVFEIRQENSLQGDVLRAFEVHFMRADGVFSFEIVDPFYVPVYPETEEPDMDSGFYFDSTQYYSAEEIAKMKRETEAQILSLQIDLKLAEQDLKEKEYELSNGEVFCEVAGTVKTVLDPAEALAAGEPMVVVSGGGGYLVKGAMGEFDLGTLHVGDTVKVSDWRSGSTYDGTITEISQYPADSSEYWYYSQNGNNNVTLYPFTVAVSEDASLRENYGVTLYLPSSGGQEQEGDSLYLQSMFIRSEGGRSYIYVARDGLLKKQYVATGQNLWGSYLEIRGGLTKEDYVAFPYGRNTKDGAKVIVQESIDALYN